MIIYKSYYVYRHVRPDINKPFYIGIGTKRKRLCIIPSFKSEYERAFVFNHRSTYWNHIFQKCNKQIEVEILYESNSYSDIKQKEIEFIKLYGRFDLQQGPLVNFTDGGEGSVNYIFTEDHKRKISENLLALKMTRSDETKQKISAANKGQIRRKNPPKQKIKLPRPKRINSIETREKISISNKGRLVSAQTRKKISESNKGKKVSEETKAKLRKAWITRPSPSLETRIKISKSSKGRISPPITEETRLKLRISHQGKKASIETRKKMSLAHKGFNHTEESKIKIGLSSKGRNKGGYK